MSEELRRQDPLEAVTSLALEVASVPVAEERHVEGRKRLLEAFPSAHRPKARAATPRIALAALAALTLAGAAAALWPGLSARNRPLRYDVLGAASSAAGYVSAAPSAPAEVRFSDGSDVVVAAGTRLRVEETRKDGARILVERGIVNAHVKHEAQSSWLFVAGPFDIHVTGTKLAIDWDPVKEEIDVTLYEGSVEIESPVGPSRYSVRAGHRFHASVLEETVKMDDARSASGAAANPVGSTSPPSNSATNATSTAEPPAPAPIQESQAIVAPTPTTAPHEEPWPELVRRGAFEAVVLAAKSRGLTGCLATCSAADVRALADAARYVGDTDNAKKSLLALRSRFPGSRNSAAAAFLLGRTSESTGDLSSADRWYRTYLSESANGEFAADALAGRMRTSKAVEGAQAGASVAREYLRRYPDGVHAAAARKLVGPD
jgi:TolA-binding protein